MSNGETHDDPPPHDEPIPIYLGPYETWNFGDGRAYAFPALREHVEFITALAEIKFDKTVDAAAAAGGGTTGIGTTQRLAWNPTLWNPQYLHFRPFVVYNPSGRIDGLESLRLLLGTGLKQLLNPLLVDIEQSRARIAFPIPRRAMHPDQGRDPEEPDWCPDEGLRGRIGDRRITIFAVIDDGLPFAHRNFRDASGARTRVEFCWLQAATICDKQHSVLFGREYTRERIEELIDQFGGDEDELYREAGATTDRDDLGSLINRHATHGAHVMDLGTGYAEERGETPPEEIRVIAVQLPNTIAWDTSGFGKDMYMLSAFHYIFDRADRIAKGYCIENVRLVINFSYGFSGGRHDGGTELEAAINEMVQLRRKSGSPTALVLPSGNNFLDAMHARISEADFKDNRAELYWRIQPNDRTSSYLELWFAKGIDPSKYVVELHDPFGQVRQTISVTPDPIYKGQPGDPRRTSGLQNQSGQSAGELSADCHRGDCWRVLVVMAPTEPDDASLPAMEAGRWTVVVTRGDAAGPLKLPIQCWIQRADDPESLRSGSRQSYFDHADNVHYTPQGDLKETDTFESEVKRFGSLSGLATGQTSLIVGGYRLGAGVGSSLKYARPASYSSAGTRGETGLSAQVACASMSDRSRVLSGTWAAGNRSGSLSLVQGTSAAAPFVARQLATAFVTADDASVAQAETQNYRDLLRGYDGDADEPTTARLGAIRVPPHWQPGLDLTLLDEN
ncbi:hypothetical protein [Bradyrhizobium sp. UNPF46]|uniref:hypothetical protein n=1 Tax=Bradyrhizobium sp. UNPF46 TaxID=1141168 RepID=UPI001152AAC8|nr:hypothetical protein [Bradyrhizobium sp. UNPF46]